MKYICSADWHLRSTNPVSRLDDYSETILRKIGFIVECANQYNAAMLVAGDLLHNTKVSTVSYEAINRLSALLKQCTKGVYAVPGQHDLLNHNEDITKSPYGTLVDSGAIINIAVNPALKQGTIVENIYGCGWGYMDFTDNEHMHNSSADIVLLHFCVTPGDPPFFLAEQAKKSSDVASYFNSYMFIIAGDYHIAHKYKHKNTLLINCGSVGRSNKDQMNHKPACYLIDTDKPGKVKRIIIPHKSAEEVFSKASLVQDTHTSEFSDKIKELSELLKDKKKQPNFKNTVLYLMKKYNTTKEEIELAESYME